MCLRNVFLCFFVLLGSLTEAQQQLHWNRILLPAVNKHINIKSIEQDVNGFIWLGGNSGLYRFDGHVAKKIEFTKVIQADKKVRDILALDTTLYLIVGNTNLVQLNTQTFDYEIVYTSDLVSEGYFSDIETATNGQLYLATSHNYLLTFDPKKGNEIIAKSRIPGSFVVQKLLISSANKYLGTRTKGLCILDKANRTHLLPASGKFPYPGYSIEVICALNDSILVLGGWDNGLHMYNLNDKKINHFIFNDARNFQYDGDEITCMLKVDSTEVWFGTKLSGIYSFSLLSKQIKPIRSNLNLGKWIYTIFSDHFGNTWLSSDNGLYIWSKENQLIEQFSFPLDENMHQLKKVYAISGQNSQFLFGTEDGVYHIDEEKKSSSFLQTNYKGAQLGVYSFLWNKHQNPILGTNKALYSLDLASGALSSAVPKYAGDTSKSSSFSPNSIVSSRYTNVISYSRDSSDYLLASTYGHGLFEYNKSNGHGNFSIIIHENIYGYLITNLLVDKHNKLWATCKENGIFYNFSHKVSFSKSIGNSDTSYSSVRPLRRFEAEKHWYADGKNGLSNQNITCFVERKNGSFWVGTDGGGMYYFDPTRTPEFVRIAKTIDSPTAIFEDSLNRLWIIEHGILNLVDIKSNTLVKFDQYSGIAETGILPPFFRASNGYVYAGGIGNYYRFKPESIELNTTKTKVYFTGLSASYEALDTLIKNNHFELPESKSVFTINFTSQNYNRLNNINYKYHLSGVQETWVNVGNIGSITFNQLSPGDYTLKVRAFTIEELPVSEVGTIHFTIHPYWYKSWWFKLSAILFLFTLVYLFYRYRIQQLLKVQHIRDQIARDLHDDIGSTLGAINIYTKAAQNNLELNKSDRVHEILNEIGNYSREMSDHMGDIIWSVNPVNDELTHLLKRIEQYSSHLLERAQIELHFMVDTQTNEWNLSMEKRKNIYLIVKEALHNAVKYSNCTSIYLTFKKRDNRLEIQVKDNGVGFSIDNINPENGNGLSSMEARCKEMKALFQLNSSPGNGCIITLLI